MSQHGLTRRRRERARGKSLTDDGEHREAHKLNLLASDGVDEGERRPVARDQATSGDDHVADAGVVQLLPDFEASGRAGGRRASEADRVEDDGRVESETVEGDVEGEPGPGAADQDLEVLPLRPASKDEGQLLIE